MTYTRYFFLLLFFSTSVNAVVHTQNISEESVRGDLRLMFYNCENLFDIYDDSLKRDDEFLPRGDKNWSYKRYKKKLNNIYKVIIAVGGWNPPEIIGLCEIENRKVLDDLTNNTPLSRIGYNIIHYESPDRRGIDVAILYRKEYFELLKSKAITINFPGAPDYKTRDILYAKGLTKNNDSLHVFINHWPSRWSGQLESEPSRVFVASVLRQKIDSIIEVDPHANIVITGDFNDKPEDKSLSTTLRALKSYDNITNKEVYNLSYYLKDKIELGSHKYQSEWGILDQIIVSGSLLIQNSKLHTSVLNNHIYTNEFLLEKDQRYLGIKPFRTYSGFSFNDGFSDHLPVYLDLFFEK